LKGDGQAEKNEALEARVYVMTFNNIYTFNMGKKTRRYKIKDVASILQATHNTSDFILFFEKYDDLHASCKNRKDIVDLLKLRFNNLNRNTTLRCFGVNITNIVHFMKTNTTPAKRAGVFDLPDDNLRMLNDEIKGEEEFNEELRAKKGTVDTAPYEAKNVFNNESATDLGGDFNFNGADNDGDGQDGPESFE
jgi:hypothetical protein